MKVAIVGYGRMGQMVHSLIEGSGVHEAVSIVDPSSSSGRVTSLSLTDAVLSRADVAIELAHEGLAERHDFTIGFAFGIEIASAFSAAHREGRQAVLEDLLESEELQDAQVHGRMEAETAFVRPDRAVELNAIALIDLDFAFVIHPGNLEHDDAFRNDNALKNLVLFILAVAVQKFSEGFEDFRYALDEFLFPSCGLLDALKHSLCIAVHVCRLSFWLIESTDT